MSLRIYEDLEQGTEEWLQARAGIVTASVMGQLVTTKTVKPASNETSRGLTAQLVAERITGHVEESYTSADMQRGILSEPYARDVYSEHFAPVQEVGFMVREDDGIKVGYSPDGLVDSDGLIEIKSPRAKTHVKTILEDCVPPEYMAQLQTGLLVSDRDWIDFVSYCGGHPLYVNRVYPDQAWRQAIVSAVGMFEQNAEAMITRYRDRAKHMPPTERLDLFLESDLVI